MARRYRSSKKTRAARPKFATKTKVTARITTPLSKDLWVSGAKAIEKERDRILEEQGGLCALLGEPVIKPCLDHDHYDAKCRGVLSSVVNLWEGKVQELWGRHVSEYTNTPLSVVLRRMADYLEEDRSSSKFHGETVASLKTYMKKLTKETIVRRGKDLLGIEIDPEADKAEQIRVYVVEFIRQIEENYLNER
jgi:hypothetical protein